MNKIKLRKKKVTVNDLLAQDDVNELLADLDNIKPDIKHAIVFYETNDGTQTWRMSTEMKTSECLGLIEVVKARLIRQSEDEDDD